MGNKQEIVQVCEQQKLSVEEMLRKDEEEKRTRGRWVAIHSVGSRKVNSTNNNVCIVYRN
jgi:hypothetical protein